MKTKKGLTKRLTVLVSCVSLMLLTVGAWTAFAADPQTKEGCPPYQTLGVSAQSVEQIEGIWGKPVLVNKLTNGDEVRYYKNSESNLNGSGAGVGNRIDRMFVFRDGTTIGTANVGQTY